ncbi:Benzyl alcohol O-benzoyltransferase [Melia azedarach]|uniref:Benzyl alcohol O-benzoyltransferase n=1 Tax=Melia azedarach TaxID=155640 RepID=A0ACC1YMM1_MELAZ|nr:Benzyl alcohol O-benzoyltransferase [Melia azedarach]
MEAKSFELFSVTRKEPELIVPARPTPREVKQLSDIDDQESLRVNVPVISFYRNNPSPLMKGKDPVKVIREALSKALVFYYPVAGRLLEGPNRKLMVDCNGEGVLFVEADANFKLEQLGDSIRPPFPYEEEVMYGIPGFTEIIGRPLLFIQVTRLTCGGFILALLFNHTIFDAPGFLQFSKTLMEFAGGADSPSLMPVWQREVLSARDPPQVTCIHHEYEKINESKDDQLAKAKPVEPIKSFYFGPKEINSIRNHVAPHLQNASKFELVTACVWRCRTIALELDPDQIVRLSSVVNVRGKHYNILPLGYYGNAFAYPAVCTKVDDLCKNPLGYAVELVKKAKAKMSEEYMKSVADYMVIMERPMFTIEGNFFVSNISTVLAFEELDFGWGGPVYAGPAGALPLLSFQLKYKNKDGEDGILVLLCMSHASMERFEKELNEITQGSVEDLCKIKHTEILSKL